MKIKRYTDEDLRIAYEQGMKKSRLLLVKDILILSKEFIHPKFMNSFEVKIRGLIK